MLETLTIMLFYGYYLWYVRVNVCIKTWHAWVNICKRKSNNNKKKVLCNLKLQKN